MNNIEPKTYWEKRCAISEHLTEQLFRIVAENAPTDQQEALSRLWQEYATMQTQLLKEPDEVKFIRPTPKIITGMN